MRESFNPANLKKEQEKWNKILADQNMPEEPLKDEAAEEEHTAAYEEGITELYKLYAETDPEDWGVHREQLHVVADRMKAAGATPEELSLLSEDFAREIQDTVENVQKAAQSAAQDLVRERAGLVLSRPEAACAQIERAVRKAAPPLMSKEVIAHVARQALEVASPHH